MLWSIGKDSTALLWMVRKAFLGDVPFPVVLLDTGMEFPEVYAFRDWLIANGICPFLTRRVRRRAASIRRCRRLRVTRRARPPGCAPSSRERYHGIILGIRRDEQAIRAKERIFRPRNADGSWDPRMQPPELWDYFPYEVPDGAHVRIHPLLDWTEIDIWRYTKRENIPYVPLYLAKNGKRYRSLGESNITIPIASTADTFDKIIEELEGTRQPERAGRAMDNESEDTFERLRTSGYM